jgi:putative transposase
LQEVILRVERAFAAFFLRGERGERGETSGYPRFQGRTRYHSFTYPQYGDNGGAVLDGGILSLSKIGRILIRLHRPLHGTPETVTISWEADGWYACFSCAEVPIQPLPPTGCQTGIDVGLRVFLISAAGDVVDNPRHYRRAERQPAKAHRHVARRTRGSHRRAKAVRRLRRIHQKVQCQRRDFHHKTALALLRQYDTLYLEDVRVANLVRNRHLAKSISDAGWYQFRTILAGKAAYAGRQVLLVPPAYISQECSGCGERVRKSLSVRTHICPCCGLVLDRDENAARNIQWAGQALRGVPAMVEATNREAPCL